jgi:putative ABC transport system permease protein
MVSIFKQIGAVTSMNVRSIPQRAAMSIASVVAVALTITVLLFFLALSSGLGQTVRGSGSDDVVLAIREGSNAELNSVVSRDQLTILSSGPNVRHRDNAPIASGELLVIVDGIKRSSGTKANVSFRGISPEGLALRHGVHIAQGRMFHPGTNEMVVGAGVVREFRGFELGRTIRLRGTNWQVVGVFEAPGTLFESELWGDVAVTQSLFNRPNVFQTMRIQLTSAAAVQAYTEWAKHDVRLSGLEVISERRYYARQAAQSTQGFIVTAFALGLFMAIGSLSGALNTMYSSVATRSAEIATLRIIGFSGWAAFFGTMAEALMLCAAGGILGILISLAAFNGRSAATLGSGFTQQVFRFEISPAIMITAIVVAMLIGVVGGLLPGIRAARVRPQLELAAQ